MIKIDEIKTLYIGKQGENSANIAVFDLTDWVEEYGAGTAKLVHQRNGDEIPYIAQTTQSGSTLSWIFTSDDTAFNGYGKAQLNYYVDDVLAKTLIFTTKCDKSLTDETEAPGEVKSALDLIAGTVDGKLSPSNIKAGQNVTVDIDGNDVTINASGGGGTGDYSQLTNKPSINSVELIGNKSLADLGIQPSGDYATVAALNSGLATKQNAFTIGKGLTLANSVLSADTNKQLFVGSLPTENIVEKAIYYTPNYALFAGVANYITTDYPTVVVTRQNELPSKMLRMTASSNNNYNASSPSAYIYSIYDYVDGEWVINETLSVETADNQWATKMGFPTDITSSITASQAQFKSLIWYSNRDFTYANQFFGYRAEWNITDVNGIPLDTSTINFCLFNTYQYVNGAWVNYGVSDFSELFAHFNDVLNSKADSSTTYTKTEVDTAINETIGDAMIQILGGSV